MTKEELLQSRVTTLERVVEEQDRRFKMVVQAQEEKWFKVQELLTKLDYRVRYLEMLNTSIGGR
jgi:hypothetical protein